MRIGVETNPSVAAILANEYRAGEQAVTSAMKSAADGAKLDWRQDIVGAGLGQRLSKTIRARSYPERGRSISGSALIWTKAPEIIRAHDEGGVIRSSSGFWLAIPTEAAGRGTGGARLTPGEWERRRGIPLRLIYRPGKPGLLVADGARINNRGLGVASRSKTGRGVATVPIFVLVPQVTLRRRLDVDAIAAEWAGRVPGLIVQRWRSDRIGGA